MSRNSWTMRDPITSSRLTLSSPPYCSKERVKASNLVDVALRNRRTTSFSSIASPRFYRSEMMCVNFISKSMTESVLPIESISKSRLRPWMRDRITLSTPRLRWCTISQFSFFVFSTLRIPRRSSRTLLIIAASAWRSFFFDAFSRIITYHKSWDSRYTSRVIDHTR